MMRTGQSGGVPGMPHVRGEGARVCKLNGRLIQIEGQAPGD